MIQLFGLPWQNQLRQRLIMGYDSCKEFNLKPIDTISPDVFSCCNQSFFLVRASEGYWTLCLAGHSTVIVKQRIDRHSEIAECILYEGE